MKKGSGSALISLLILAGLSFAGAQDTSPPSCLQDGDTISRPGENHVKPPQLVSRAGDAAHAHDKNSRVQLSLELVLNSEGRICETRILRASDAGIAKRVADNVRNSFKFKPATLDGKPVAVRFVMNFDLHD